jgi:mannosyltransferase
MKPESGAGKNKVPFFLLSAIFALGCGLRFYQLGEKSLWTDELVIITNAVSIVDIQSFLAHTRGDDLPKFYSLLFKYWMMLGDSEFTMRALSAVFGCLSIVVTYAVSRLFFDVKTSLAAAFLTAISPFLLIYDREIRMYSLFALFSSLSTYLYIRCLREDRTSLWVLYAAVNVLNVYTHYYAFLVIGVQWLFLLIRFRDYRQLAKPWILANAVIVAAFSIRLASFIQDVAYHAPWALPRERFPFVFAKHVVEFFYIFFSLSAGQTILPWNPLAAVIYLSAIVCFVLAMRKGVRFSGDQLYLVLLVFVPILIGIAVRIAMPRYFVFVAPVFFMLVARGAFLLPKNIMVGVVLLILTGWGYGIANYYENRQFHIMAHVDPWREVAHFLKNNIKAGEEIVIAGIGFVPLRHYYGGPLPGYSEEGLIEKIKQLDHDGKERIWLVYTYQEEYPFWLRSRDILGEHYDVAIERKWVQDPDFERKKKYLTREFAPYRIVAELYQRK